MVATFAVKALCSRVMFGRLTATASLALLIGCSSESPPAEFTGTPVPSSGGLPAVAAGAGGAAGMAMLIVGAGGIVVPTGGAAGAALATGGAAGAPPATGGAAGASGGSAAGGASPVPSSTAYVPPPGALPDITFDMASTVPPGGETLKCIYAQMPSDRGVIAVPSAESQFTPGSHHLLAYRSDLTAIPSGQTGVWDCADGAWMVHERGSYYEAQQPVSRRDLPPGVAHRFQPGEVVIVQTHYLNANTDPLDAHAELTLHTVDVATVPSEAGSIIFTDVNIQVAPGAKSRSIMSCPVTTDIHPALLWSHMHKQGSNFMASTDDAAAAAAAGPGLLYAEDDWDEPHPRAYPYDPPITLHAGSHINFSCDFANPNSYALTFGQSAEKNEMCILHGMYWPRITTGFEQCQGGMSSRTDLTQ